MPNTKTLKSLHAAVEQAEYALAQAGDDLLFQVKPEGGLEIVRRGQGGLPGEPVELVANLAGADPLLWQAARPEGAITLGRPYKDPQPRCTLSGLALRGGAPVELYYRGRPVAAERALALSPRLVYLQAMTYFFSALLYELRAHLPPRGEVGEADKVGEAGEAVGATVRTLWDDFLGRLQALSKDAAREGDPCPKPGDVPEEN